MYVSFLLVSPCMPPALPHTSLCGVLKVLYAMLVLYGIARPSMLMASNVFAVAALELSATTFENPINSLVDSAARLSFGAKG